MLEIKYEIKLNEHGRPYIDLPPDYPQVPENQFFALEMCRYILQKTHAGMKVPPFDQHTVDTMDESIRMLGQISDEVARLLWHSMKTLGDATFDMVDFHVQCNNIEERNKIDEKGILHNDKIYVRQEGLRVLTRDVDDIWKIFELIGGITNDNWVEINELY
jgi:hypothetical protein